MREAPGDYRKPDSVRAIMLPEGGAEPYVFVHRFRSVYAAGKALGTPVEVVDSRYWPLVIGLYPRSPLVESRRNVLAEALLDVPPDRQVYGDAVLFGYDPLIRKFASVADWAIFSAVEAYEFSQALHIDVLS